jgi:hypothetical protein
MANWALVEDNQITGKYDLLPKNWRNISGLDLSKDDLPFLKSLGWYPVVGQNTPFDDTKYFIQKYDYTIGENSVSQIPVLVERTFEPAGPVENYSIMKHVFILELRKERNQRLLDSDWTQLTDIQSMLNEETKNKWAVYRQALRDITLEYLNNGVIDISQVNWPEILKNLEPFENLEILQ